MSFIVAKAEQHPTLEITNYGVETPRSEILSYDIEGYFDRGKKAPSRFVDPIEEWLTVNDNTFETTFTKPFAWLGRQLFLRINGASAPYSVELNGKSIAKVANSASPCEINISKSAIEGLNTLRVVFNSDNNLAPIEEWKQDSRDREIGDSYVVAQPTQMIHDLFVRSHTEGENLVTQIGVVIKSHALNPRTSNISIALQTESSEVISLASLEITQQMRGEDTLYLNTITPLAQAWQSDSPTIHLLKLSTKHEGRYVEHQTYSIALRAVELNNNGELLINGKKVEVKAKKITSDFNPMELYKLKDQGYNSVIVRAGEFNRMLLNECDREGIYVILTAPINTSTSSQSINRGGNISNNPLWRNAFIERVQTAYYTTQLHPSIIAYAIAEDSSNGYNLYESYLEMKNISTNRPVLYLNAAGEWNSDIISIEID